jgi:hypothetical protein
MSKQAQLDVRVGLAHLRRYCQLFGQVHLVRAPVLAQSDGYAARPGRFAQLAQHLGVLRLELRGDVLLLGPDVYQTGRSEELERGEYQDAA